MTNRDDLLARLDAPSAEAWIPERPGDLLVGAVVARSSRDAGYGAYPIITVHPERVTVNGVAGPTAQPLAWHAMGTVAESKVTELAVRAGGRIAVRFDGERTSRQGSNYKVWSVAYDPPAPGTDLVGRLDQPAPADDDEEPF
jgi:hypothetical protein